MLIALTQWAANHDRTDAAARNIIKRGKLPQAYKIGRNWVIESDVSWPEDKRYTKKECQIGTEK